MGPHATTTTEQDQRAELTLRLHFSRGIGPVLGRRILGQYSSVEGVFQRGTAGLRSVPGIGQAKAKSLLTAFEASGGYLSDQRTRAADLGARIVALSEPGYPRMLAPLDDAPLALTIRGNINEAPAEGPPMMGVAIVGSRRATAYGIEQAERFSSQLAGCGLTVVSGGARGIDAAAHRACLRAGGRTIAVLGCGVGRTYPPEHGPLYDEIVEAGGAVMSEYPVQAEPAAEHFPARNRIVSGLSLGVLVVEAPRGSGALITARIAIDQHGRDVLAIPGRIDTPSAEGCLELIKKGEAALATSPADVIDLLEAPARHAWQGTHADRYESLTQPSDEPRPPAPPSPPSSTTPAPATRAAVELSEVQQRIVEAMSEPLTLEGLCRLVDAPAAEVQAQLTMLELKRVIVREGPRFMRR